MNLGDHIAACLAFVESANSCRLPLLVLPKANLEGAAACTTADDNYVARRMKRTFRKPAQEWNF